jgi:membrane associated rhomboid family serine protease
VLDAGTGRIIASSSKISPYPERRRHLQEGAPDLRGSLRVEETVAPALRRAAALRQPATIEIVPAVLPLRDNVPTRRFPVVTVALIAANAAVWILYQVPELEESVFRLGFLPCEPEGTCDNVGYSWPANVFTSMFAHASWFHVIGNMLFLWIFGNNVEDALGRVRYLVFYLAAGVAATAAQTAVTLWLGAPEDAAIPSVGASGAISGVLAAYLVLFPLARVVTLVFVFIVEIPAMLFLVTWFGLQLWLGSFSLVEPQSGGGVAFFAHIGGFAFGLLAIKLLVPRSPALAGSRR